MSIDELGKFYDNLSQQEQTRFLVFLLHELTLAVRGCYSETKQVVNSHAGSRVGSLNEVQHRVAGYLRLLLDDVPDRPSGSHLLGGLLVWAENGEVQDEVIYCIESALSHFRPPSHMNK